MLKSYNNSIITYDESGLYPIKRTLGTLILETYQCQLGRLISYTNNNGVSISFKYDSSGKRISKRKWLMLMINSYEIDLRILFKTFYCPICGKKLKIIKEVNKLTDEQKKIYYKELYPYGVPINLEVGKVKLMFKCHNCNYYNSTDNQLLIRKKQKLLKKIILDEND